MIVGMNTNRTTNSPEWPACLNCGELCLSDGTCLNRRCLRERLDEAIAQNKRSALSRCA
jgi:hypothetical protein